MTLEAFSKLCQALALSACLEAENICVLVCISEGVMPPVPRRLPLWSRCQPRPFISTSVFFSGQPPRLMRRQVKLPLTTLNVTRDTRIYRMKQLSRISQKFLTTSSSAKKKKAHNENRIQSKDRPLNLRRFPAHTKSICPDQVW